ncbi:MAG: hypothetical protein ABSE87_04815 [Terracidiphilus sp.]
MTLANGKGLKLARRWRRLPSAARGLAVLAGALMLAWPAFFNGFPLLYPDSMTYMDDGRIVARAVFLHHLSQYYGVRSLFYGLGILPLHWNINPWPVVALQCLLVAWVVYLVVRSISPRRTVARYLIVVALLSLLTSAGWYAAFIMPDILGPVLYLSIYLLVFAPKTLSRVERLALYPIAWWCVTAHATHLLLAAALCGLLAAFAAAFERRLFLCRLKAIGQVAAMIALAAAAQMALNGYLYGKPSLNGERPPYLTARILADGPGRWYLEKHCPQLHWATCAELHIPLTDADGFLWAPGGPYDSGTENDKRRIENEEMPFVLATVRAYPGQQFSRSAANFEGQLMAFGLYGFDPNPWILGDFAQVLPGARAGYLRSRQANDTLPLDLLTEVQFWVIVASLGTIVLAVSFFGRRHSPQLAGLSLVTVSMVVANALAGGVLSVVDDRYGCRVIWLIPLLAGLTILDLLAQRESAWPAAEAGCANDRL